jgi:hypothetical protein
MMEIRWLQIYEKTNCALVSAVLPRERKIDCETPSVDDASQQT